MLAAIDSKTANLNDLHSALKIIKTLPLIEEYQQKNLPPINGLKTIENSYQKLIKQADSLFEH